jgi:hypothetical protein
MLEDERAGGCASPFFYSGHSAQAAGFLPAAKLIGKIIRRSATNFSVDC